VRRRALLAALLCAWTPSLVAALHTWTGAASDVWSSSANWTGGAPRGDEANVRLAFPRGGTRRGTNDLHGLKVEAIFFSGGDYVLAGERIVLGAGGVTVGPDVTSAVRLDLPIALGAPQTWTVAAAAASLLVGGAVSEDPFFAGAGLEKRGEGTLTLSGVNGYRGPTVVRAGILVVNGSQPSSPVTVLPGSRLGGTGYVGPVTADGHVLPGPRAGRLRTPAVVFHPGSSLTAELSARRSAACDQLNVRGPVSLAGRPDLRLTASAGIPEGTSFTILASSGGITGTFAGLPGGATVDVGEQAFRIDYRRGVVVLTRVGPPDGTAFVELKAAR